MTEKFGRFSRERVILYFALIIFLVGTVSAVPSISFISPTVSNGTIQLQNFIYINTSSSGSPDHYVLTDFNRSLLFWMRMDDRNSSGGYVDLSSYGFNGTGINGSVTNATFGRWGNGTNFNGSSQYINIDGTSTAGLGVVNGSIWGWVKTTGLGSSSYRGLFVKTNAYNLYLKDGNVTIFDYRYLVDRPTSKNLSDGNWHFVGMNFLNGTTNGVTVYVDNVLIATTNFTTIADNNPLRIGASDSGGPAFFFNGQLDDIMIFNRTLSTTEIGALYNATANRYENNFTNLNLSTYTINSYAVESTGSLTYAQLFVTITDTISTPTTCTNYVGNSFSALSGLIALLVVVIVCIALIGMVLVSIVFFINGSEAVPFNPVFILGFLVTVGLIGLITMIFTVVLNSLC